MQPVNVVVTCTKQKSIVPDSSLELRNVSGGTIAHRVVMWKRKLDLAHGPVSSPRSLYAGDHWSVVKDIARMSVSGRVIQVWVISAGYGLLSMDSPIHPYSATFSTRHADTVVLDPPPATTTIAAENKREWWNELVRQAWNRERPFSVAELANEFPDSPLVIAASMSYLKAIQDDLTEAVAALRNKSQLCLLSGGTDTLGGLSASLVPLDARMQPLVGGVLRSLNVRCLRYFLQHVGNGKIGYSSMAKKFNDWLAKAPELRRTERRALSDSELRDFILAKRKLTEKVSRTRLLRELRESGHACEQGRFRNLFNEVEATTDG